MDEANLHSFASIFSTVLTLGSSRPLSHQLPMTLGCRHGVLSAKGLLSRLGNGTMIPKPRLHFAGFVSRALRLLVPATPNPGLP